MSRRIERIGRLLQQTIARIVQGQLSDPRIDPARMSVTRVEVQEDLLCAKVYVSVMGEPPAEQRALEALNHATGRIHAILREAVQLRHIPALEFLADRRFKGAIRTWQIIREAMDELRDRESARGQAAEPEEKVSGGGPTDDEG
jgi:ribosome-binding factor A